MLKKKIVEEDKYYNKRYIFYIFYWYDNNDDDKLLLKKYFSISCYYAYRSRPFRFGPVQPVLVRQFVLLVLFVAKEHPPQPAVGVYLHAHRLHVGRVERSLCKLGQVQMDLTPAFGQAHRHGAHVRASPGGPLVVAHANTAPEVIVVQNLQFPE